MINFRLIKSTAEDINLSRSNVAKENFELRFDVGFYDENKRVFVVRFYIDIASKLDSYTLNLEYLSIFEGDSDLTDDFKNSRVPSVNAPAIAYPFLRSFVSTLTLNAGYQPVMLPTVNFQKIVREQQEMEQQAFSKKPG